jgi:hypothetical protein
VRRFLLSLAACALLGCDGGERAARRPVRTIEQVQEAHTPALMALDGVVGTFIGETAAGEPCIKVMVVQKTPALVARIPTELEGWPVEPVESGVIRPLPGDRR